MCRSISITSGCSSRARSHRLSTVGDAADHLDGRRWRPAWPRALPELLVVVDHEDAQRLHQSTPGSRPVAAASGSAASTRVPLPAVGRHGAGAARAPRRAPAWTPGRRPARASGPARARVLDSTWRASGSRRSATVQVSALAVPGGVVHGLDHDPVRRHLDGRRQRLEVVVGVDRPGHGRRPAAGRTARLCWSARCRSADTRPSWSSAGGRSPSTSRRTSAISLTRLVGELADQLGGAVGVVGDEVAGGLEPHRQRGQRRAEPVVEVAADPTTLLLAGRDQVLRGTAAGRG